MAGAAAGAHVQRRHPGARTPAQRERPALGAHQRFGCRCWRAKRAPLLALVRPQALVELDLERVQLALQLRVALPARAASGPRRAPAGSRSRARAGVSSRRSGTALVSSVMSAKAVSMPSSLSQSCSSRIPGVSMTMPPSGQDEQLAPDGRVAAAVVRLANLGGRLELLARERVDQRRLADARTSRGRQPCDARRSRRATRRCPSPRERADDVDGHAERDRLDLLAARLGVVGEVALGQQDHGRGAALPGAWRGSARGGAASARGSAT